jgi:PAS domain S-box-containing protein
MTGLTVPIKKSIATKMLLIVLAVFFATSLLVSGIQLRINYNYHQDTINEELKGIEMAFSKALAVNLWGLDEKALRATIEGMLFIPALSGVSIETHNGEFLVLAGIVEYKGVTGDAGFRVSLNSLNLNTPDKVILKHHDYDVITRQFPINFEVNGESKSLGKATIYSNTSVIFKRMKMQAYMLAVNVALTFLTALLALIWVVNRYLRKPLKSLASATQELSMENLDSYKLNIELSGHNELTVLEKSFNSMIKNLSQSKKEREQAEEEYKNIFNLSMDMVCIADINGHFIKVNPAFTEILGYTEEEILAKPYLEFVHPEDQLATRKVGEEKLARGETTLFFVNRYKCINGEYKWLEWISKPLADKGVTFAIARDITDRKTAELERQKLQDHIMQARKLESIGVLAGGIAHDFNNILAALIGNIDLALLDSGLSDETRMRLHEAEKASFRARDLTQQLLTFAKGGEPVKELASLPEVIRDSADFVLRGSNVSCHYNFPDNLWLADFDKGQISQVVQNIILNASNAMPEGGTIEVSCENVLSSEVQEAVLRKDTKYVKMTFKDKGIGISADNIERIFDPYYTTKQHGSGLGLAITHSIVKKHDGQINVESQIGTGTTFRIYLPASEEHLKSDSFLAAADSQPKKARIMIMDDEEQIRKISQAMIQSMGHDAILAKDGSEAAHLFEQMINNESSVDLIIMDLTIPGGMGGKEAVKNILSLDPNAKVVVSSGYSNAPIMSAPQEYGFFGTLVKPYRRKDLEKVIREVLTSKE